MKKYLKLIESIEYTGLTRATLTNILHSKEGSQYFHKLTEGRTAPIYVDIEGLCKAINRGDFDKD